MIAAIARAAMILAVRCMGDHRRDWAQAMLVEFEAARADGRPLGFAIGCLVGACRTMSSHEEGRFGLVSHALALGVMVPVAALLMSGVLFGLPLGEAPGVYRFVPLVNAGNRAAMPAMILLVMALAAGQLRLAWLVLDRRWDEAASIGTLAAAMTATLALFASVLFARDTGAMTEAVVLGARAGRDGGDRAVACTAAVSRTPGPFDRLIRPLSPPAFPARFPRPLSPPASPARFPRPCSPFARRRPVARVVPLLRSPVRCCPTCKPCVRSPPSPWSCFMSG